MNAPATLCWLVLFIPLTAVRGETPRQQQARGLERDKRWFEAACVYDELLSKDRNHEGLREDYRRCLRHFRQQRRLEDVGLQSLLSKLSTSEASELHEKIMDVVVRHYADRSKLDSTDLFRQSLSELRASITAHESAFLQRHQGRINKDDLAAFRAMLDQWDGEKVANRNVLRSLSRRIIVGGSQQRMPPGVVALELACGIANSLDEYSLYIAPSRLNHADAVQKNKAVGIGIEVSLVAQKLEVSRVYRKSPAALSGLVRGDRITRIDGQWVDPLAPDIAAERLLGESGSPVELEFIPRGQMMPVTLKLERQAILPISVDAELRGEMGSYVGYLHIHSFQKSTFQEIKDILNSWQGLPLRGLILDLRGNPGGLLESALNVAELFLSEGIIAHLSSPLRKLNITFKSHNLTPLTLPLAVLTDGETASSAEVLAGALKDNQRACIIGQPTYGKGSVQSVFPLEQGPGGLRLTVARFSTPSKVPFVGRGIAPTHPFNEPDPEAAIKEAERLLRGMGVMMVQ